LEYIPDLDRDLEESFDAVLATDVRLVERRNFWNDAGDLREGGEVRDALDKAEEDEEEEEDEEDFN
jgi:hypothetical protein